MKRIILFGFEDCLSSRVIKLQAEYVRLSYSGRRYRIRKSNLERFDRLVERLLSDTKTNSIAWWTSDQSANAIFKEITSLESMTIPILKFETEEDQLEIINRLSKNVDQIVIVGRDTRLSEAQIDCEVVKIHTDCEMDDESWDQLESILFCDG